MQQFLLPSSIVLIDSSSTIYRQISDSFLFLSSFLSWGFSLFSSLYIRLDRENLDNLILASVLIIFSLLHRQSIRVYVCVCGLMFSMTISSSTSSSLPRAFLKLSRDRRVFSTYRRKYSSLFFFFFFSSRSRFKFNVQFTSRGVFHFSSLFSRLIATCREWQWGEGARLDDVKHIEVFFFFFK